MTDLKPDPIIIRETQKTIKGSQMVDYPVKTIQLISEEHCTVETRDLKAKGVLLEFLAHYANAAGVEGSQPLSFFLAGKETDTQVTFSGDIKNLMQVLQDFQLSSKATTEQAIAALETLKPAEQSSFKATVSGVTCN